MSIFSILVNYPVKKLDGSALVAEPETDTYDFNFFLGLEAVAGCVTYSTSKFALRGFMDSLREELRANNHHDYISTTTVFTTFINTRRDLVVFLKERLR